MSTRAVPQSRATKKRRTSTTLTWISRRRPPAARDFFEGGQGLVARHRLGEEPCAGAGQERLRGHGQGHVPVPAHPASHLVLVRPDLALALDEALVNGPMLSGDARDLFQARVGRTKDRVGSDLPGLGAGAAQEQKALPSRAMRVVDPRCRPVEDARSLGACGHADLCPRAGSDWAFTVLTRCCQCLVGVASISQGDAEARSVAQGSSRVLV